MTNTWALSALWVGLALVATLLAIWFKISTALSEIVVGTVAQLVIGAFLAQGGLLGGTPWITFLAGTGGNAGTYYTLMMSTGLTFGTISALFGLNHQIITQTQYSYIVGTVIGSAVIPTMIANTFFLPRHLLTHGPAGDALRQVAQRPTAAEEA